jgi:hypothetical protein
MRHTRQVPEDAPQVGFDGKAIVQNHRSRPFCGQAMSTERIHITTRVLHLELRERIDRFQQFGLWSVRHG